METSIVDVVIGMQYGDEGKGKIANQMAASGEYDYVVRFNGGGNAGHTIYLNGEKIVTHLVPCGILHGIPSVIGNGCVINTQKLFDELEYLEGFGFDTSILKIAENAHIITQDHIDEDSKDTTIGTTRTGNGPCYKDKVGRTGLRAKDVPELAPYLVDMYSLIHSSPKKFLAEGAQGYWLDVDFGDYPYVTSSNTGVGALLNNGFNFKQVRDVVGVIKCYSTYVGAKDYQQVHDDRFEKLREIGQEYGATTGRPRQIDWLNLDEVNQACQMNGVTKLIVNKMDVLAQIENGWDWYQDGKLHFVDDEGSFMLCIMNQIMKYNPGIEIEFQGQLH
jgi:adenylosuccinate synthase